MRLCTDLGCPEDYMDWISSLVNSRWRCYLLVLIKEFCDHFGNEEITSIIDIDRE